MSHNMNDSHGNSPIGSTGRRIRHRKHANPLTICGPITAPPWEQIYGRIAPMALDVGFGEGRFLCELAQSHPEWNVLGLEIRPHLVQQALAVAHGAGINNVHAMMANANFHLDALIPDGSVQFVAVNFPDPWYKQRHRKRRVVRPEWVQALLPKLTADAQIHVMSDYEPLAREMRKVFEANTALRNMDGPMQYAAESTTGIQTEREIKHMGRGETIYRMRFAYERLTTDWQGGCIEQSSSGMEEGKSMRVS